MKRNVKKHAVVQPQDQSIKLIPLTKNQNAIVDAADHDWLMQWNWCARYSQKTESIYAGRREEGSGYIIRMHRQILGLERGDDREGDHRNGDTLDYRRRNLRIATRHQNARNGGLRKNNTSGVKGVYWDRGRWVARITVDWKGKNLGRFTSIEDARSAYNEAAKRLHGTFARLA